MDTEKKKYILATRGSPLALAQAFHVQATCQHAFPHLKFEILIVKTSGDKLQKASLSHTEDAAQPPTEKGLFTKELEEVLLQGKADMAVHSLKDLPTELPEGLCLNAVLRRADVRDVLIYRSEVYAKYKQDRTDKTEWVVGSHCYTGFKKNLTIQKLPLNATIATSSTRRAVQIHKLRPDIKIIPIRGNVGTRMTKLKNNPEIDATILAAAGLERLGFHIFKDGHLTSQPQYREEVEGLLATPISLNDMLPCVGQAAIGIETRTEDEQTRQICNKINHPSTHICITAERAFLKQMGGGCQSPVAAYGQIIGHKIQLSAVSFQEDSPVYLVQQSTLNEPENLGVQVANRLR